MGLKNKRNSESQAGIQDASQAGIQDASQAGIQPGWDPARLGSSQAGSLSAMEVI